MKPGYNLYSSLRDSQKSIGSTRNVVKSTGVSKTQMVRPPVLVFGQNNQVYSPLRNRSGSATKRRASQDSKRRNDSNKMSDKYEAKMKQGIMKKISKKDELIKKYENRKKQLNNTSAYNTVRPQISQGEIDVDKKRKTIHNLNSNFISNSMSSSTNKGQLKKNKYKSILKLPQNMMGSIPSSKIESSSKSPIISSTRRQGSKSSIRRRRSILRPNLNPAKQENRTLDMYNSIQSQPNLNQRMNSQESGKKFKYSKMKRQSKSRSKSKQRYRKGATISSKSSQSRSREPVDRRFLKGPFCDSIQLNTITSSAVVDDQRASIDQNLDEKNQNVSVKRFDSQIEMGGANIIQSSREHPIQAYGVQSQQKNMFDHMTKDSSYDQKGFRLQPQPIVVNNNMMSRSFSPQDLDQLPSSQNQGNRENLRGYQIEQLHSDINGLRQRLLKAKYELSEIHNEKSELMAQLNQKERTTYTYKMTLQQNQSSENDPVQNPNSFKMEIIRQELNLQQRKNEKLQKEVNQFSKWNSETQYKICKVVEEQDKLKLEQKSQELELCLKMTDAEIFQKKNQHILQEMRQIIDEQQLTSNQQFQVEQQKLEIEKKIEQLSKERMKILDEYEEQNELIMTQQKDKEADKVILTRNTHWSQKTAAVQVLVFNLTLCLDNQVIFGFNSLKHFSSFDKRCQDALKILNRKIERLAINLKKDALSTWFINALQPSKAIVQNYQIAANSYDKRLLSKIFSQWSSYHIMKKTAYNSKDSAINQIWMRLIMNDFQEQKRSFFIWKECLLQQQRQQRSVRILLNRAFTQMKRQALQYWWQYSQDIDRHCRIHMLKLEYSNKFYLCSLFQAFKEQLVLMRMKRIRVQRRAFKALQDYQQYRYEMTCLNLQALQFSMVNQKYLLQACFYGLKNYKEKVKFKIMNQALKGDMDQALQDLSTFKSDFHENNMMKNKRDAVNSVKTLLAKRLYSYFQQWKKEIEVFHPMKERVKLMLIKVHNNRRSEAMKRWSNNCKHKKIKKKKMQMKMIEEQNQQIEQDTQVTKENNATKAVAVSSTNNKTNKRLIKKMFARMLKQAFDRWRDILQGTHQQEERSMYIIKKMRRRLIQDAFNIYKDVYLRTKQYEHNENRSSGLINQFRIRTLRKYYNALCAFIHVYKQQRQKMRYMVIKIQKYLLESGLKKWRLNIEVKKAKMLYVQMEQETVQLEEAYKNNSQSENKAQCLSKNLASIEHKMLKDARFMIGNYFQRFYTDKTSRMFRKWKCSKRIDSQKHVFVKRTLDHWKMYKFLSVKMAFNQMMHFQKQTFMQTNLDKTLLKIQILLDEIERNRINQQKLMKSLREEVQLLLKENELAQEKLDRIVQLLISRNQRFTFDSRKRFVFENWRRAIAAENNLNFCIQKVITQSIRHHGFQEIKARSEVVQKQRLIKSRFTQIYGRFYRKRVGDALNIWKQASYFHTINKINKLQTEHGNTNQEHEDWEKAMMKMKKDNIEEYYRLKLTGRYFEHFLKGVDYCITRRRQNLESINIMRLAKQRRNVQKWYLRAETTKRIRFNLKTMKQNKQLRVQRLIWNRLREVVYNKNRFVNTFFNFGKLMRDKDLMEGFQSLKSHFMLQKNQRQNRKNQSVKDIEMLLRQIHIKRLTKAFICYKNAVSKKHGSQRTVIIIMLKIQTQSLRDAFRKWKFINDKENLIVDMNKNGPIREQVFEAKRQIVNLKSFMKSENFTQDEIKKFYKNCKKENENLMHKLLKRLKMPPENRTLVLKYFNTWVMWIRVRQIMKYYLRFGNNSVQYFKCDMRFAFDKWKRDDKLRIYNLNRKPLKIALNLNIKQSDKLNDLAYQEADNSIVMKDLNRQRDELVTKYVASQRLAHILLRDNHTKSEMKAFSRWRWFMQKCRNIDASFALNKFVENLTYLKQKVEALKTENQNLVDENKELSQFSIDNIDVALHLQDLSTERDQMKAKLLDQDDQVEELLKQRQEILKNLEKTNDRLEVLMEERHPSRLPNDKVEQMQPIQKANIVRQRSISKNRRNVDLIQGPAIRDFA